MNYCDTCADALKITYSAKRIPASCDICGEIVSCNENDAIRFEMIEFPLGEKKLDIVAVGNEPMKDGFIAIIEEQLIGYLGTERVQAIKNHKKARA